MGWGLVKSNPKCYGRHAELGGRGADPEVHTHALQAEDEFLVVACDGLWDVLSSQRCVELARAHLRENNSPQLCAQHLVRVA